MNIPNYRLPTRMERADFARSTYSLLAQPGTTPDQVMDPDYWTHLARRMRVHDKIEVLAEDGSFDMEVRVIAIDPRGLWAHVRALRLVEGKVAVPEASGAYPDRDGYTIEWGGPHRWRIIRGSDVVARDFADQASAVEALHNIKDAKRQTVQPLIPRMSDPKPPETEEPVEPVPPPPPVEEPPETEEPKPLAANMARTRR